MSTAAGGVRGGAVLDLGTDGPDNGTMSTLRTMSKERMRAIREGLGLSLTDAAARFNVARRTYVRWEAGDRAIEGPAVVVAEWLEQELIKRR